MVNPQAGNGIWTTYTGNEGEGKISKITPCILTLL